MESLRRILLFVLTAFGTIYIWLDIAKNMRDKTLVITLSPLGWGRRRTHFSRAQQPFDYWTMLAIKVICLIGMAIFAVISGFALLQP